MQAKRDSRAKSKKQGFPYDPYEWSASATIGLNAVYCGRCLSRMLFHVQQGLLLATNRGTADESDYHLRCAYRVASGLSARADDLIDISRQTPNRILQLYNDWKSALEPDEWLNASAQALQELSATSEDTRNVGRACRNLMHEFVSPLSNQVRGLLSDRTNEASRKYLLLAETLEQGLCRPDINDWLNLPRPCLNPYELSSPPEIIEEHDPVQFEEHDEGDVSHGPDDSIVLASRGFEPGELMPDKDWLERLHTHWRKAELSADDFKKIQSKYHRLFKCGSSATGTLESLVSEVHNVMCSLVLSSSPTYERIRVDVDQRNVAIDGLSYSVDVSETQVLNRLCEGSRKQEGPISQVALQKLPGCHGKKIRDILKKLTRKIPALKPMIEGAKGRAGGYSLK